MEQEIRKRKYGVPTPISRRAFITAAAAGGMSLVCPVNASAAQRGEFTDSLGRSISFDAPVARVTPADIYAQTLMETLFPSGLVSLAKEISEDAGDFAEAGMGSVPDLPETGTTKGHFGKDFDADAIGELAPQLVLSTCMSKSGSNAQEGDLEQSFGVPSVCVDVSFGELQNTYRMLGQLFDCEARAEELASYVDDAQARAAECVPRGAESIRVFYAPRVKGKKVTTGVSVQCACLSSLGFTPVASAYDFEEKTVDFEALVSDAPTYILFDDTTLLEGFLTGKGASYEEWSAVPAVGRGCFAVAPALMHSILGSAVFAQSIGMLWAVYVLVPQNAGFDMAEELIRFYKLFYGLERSNGFMRSMLGEEARNE